MPKFEGEPIPSAETEENKELEENIPESEPRREDETRLFTPEEIAEAEEKELKEEAERIYQEEFIERLDEVLEHEFSDKSGRPLVLQKLVDKHLAKFSDSKAPGPGFGERRANLQRSFIKELTKEISKIPFASWAIDFESAIETGKLNCSSKTALTGLLIEKYKGELGPVTVEHGHPYVHAINVVTFADGRVFYVDSANNVFEDLELGKNTRVENKDELKIYKINKPKNKRMMGYRLVPVTDFREGVLNSYLGNLAESYGAAEGDFSEDFRASHDEEDLFRLQKEAESFISKKRYSKEDVPRIKQMEMVSGGSQLETYSKSDEFKEEAERWQRDKEDW